MKYAFTEWGTVHYPLWITGVTVGFQLREYKLFRPTVG